jgi:hypothetical protein
VEVGPDLSYNGGSYDAFVARVNADGTGLDYCGYIGGDEDDGCLSIAVDSLGSAYLSGYTESRESSFPVKVGPDLTFNGGLYFEEDAFVAKVNAQGTELVYCGYIGGDMYELAWGIAVDTLGNAYVTGGTNSAESTFPVKGGPGLFFSGDPLKDDGFVARVNAKGTALDYCGYIGGDGHDDGLSIAVDQEGNAYVAGATDSTESTFPVKTGPDLSCNGSTDAFVAKITYLSLATDMETLPETGGTVHFNLDAGTLEAERNYLLLGSVSGTEPGLPLPGGLVTLPLNWDAFTDLVIALINTSVFTNFLGTLDGDGTATAQLNAPSVPGIAGVTMHYAYALNNPFDFVSNPVAIRIVE